MHQNWFCHLLYVMMCNIGDAMIFDIEKIGLASGHRHPDIWCFDATWSRSHAVKIVRNISLPQSWPWIHQLKVIASVDAGQYSRKNVVSVDVNIALPGRVLSAAFVLISSQVSNPRITACDSPICIIASEKWPCIQPSKFLAFLVNIWVQGLLEHTKASAWV